jgi:ATP/maltotriose-dependent transcriptional regulator MalT/DNA-binding SARP family transcriptional activator
LTLVSAPAGYGKTTLLAHFADHMDLALIWYMLDLSDNDPTTFFDYLLTGIATQLPGFGAATRALLSNPHTATQVEQVATALLNELTTTRHSLAIVLDDYHVITALPIHTAIDLLLAHLPPHIHLVIVTRADPPLALARLRARGQLFEIHADDLRFTRAETTQLLRDVAGLELSDAGVAILAEKTEGWVTGLQLAATSLRQRTHDEWAGFIHAFGGATRPIFDYLADEVCSRQLPRVQSFLTRSAILRDMPADLCDYVLEIENSQATLEWLERANLFTSPLDATRTAYRYHALFREFLHRRLLQVEGREAVRRLHRRAAAWFLERSDDEQAIEHLLAAGDYEAAADLVRPLRERLFHTSRYHLLEGWLKQFPPSIAEHHPWLLLTRSQLATLCGDHAQGEQFCLQAEPILQAQGNHAGLYTVYHNLAGIAQSRGNFVQAEEFHRRALDYAVDDTQRAVTLGRLARCLYMRGGEVQKALCLLDQAMELAEQSGHPLGRAGLFSLKGKMLSSLGDFTGALDVWHTALDLMEAYGNRHQQIGILNNVAYYHCLLGQFDRAEAPVRRALELAQTFGRQNEYAYTLNVQGVIHQGRGEWKTARRCYEEALTIQRRLGEEYETAVTLNWLGLLARREGKLNEALRRGEEGLALREKLGNDYETGLALIDVGATRLELGHLEQARVLWQRALDIFTRHQAHYEQAQLYFYLAVLAHRRGESGAAHTHLTVALDLAQRYGYDYIFVQDAAWAAPLLAPLAMRDSPFAPHVFLRLGRSAFDTLLPLLDDPDPAARARAATLLGHLGDATALKPLAAHRRDPDPAVRHAAERAWDKLLVIPPPPLRVQCLGCFRVWRDGKEITRWPRRSARDVFLLLLLRRPQPVAADALAETLWPGSTPDKASQNLRRAVSDLRRILEPELPAGFPSRYLRVEQETYALILPPGSHVDDKAFERESTRELAVPIPSTLEERQAAINRLETALSHYTGDYLSEFPYEDWALTRREYLRHLLTSGAHRLAQLCLDAGQLENAIATAHCALVQEPWDEEATLVLMQAHAALGNILAALRTYEAHRERLQRDLDLPPRDDLTALYEQLRHR